MSMEKTNQPKRQERYSHSEEETLLEIIDFEQQIAQDLALVKREAEDIVQQARNTAKEMIEQEKSKFSMLDEEYEKKIQQEVEHEKEKILKEKEKSFEHLKNIDKTKVDKIVGLALQKITMGKI